MNMHLQYLFWQELMKMFVLKIWIKVKKMQILFLILNSFTGKYNVNCQRWNFLPLAPRNKAKYATDRWSWVRRCSPITCFQTVFQTVPLFGEIQHLEQCLVLSVWGCSGCCNRMPQAGWLINIRNLFLIALEAGSPSSRCQQVVCLLTAHFLVHVCNMSLQSCTQGLFATPG